MQIDTATFYLKTFDKYTEEFATTFSSFGKKVFNTPIAEGKWSPGQYVEHMILAETGTTKLINKTGVIEEGRAPDALCAKLEKAVLDIDHSAIAHAAISPEHQEYNRGDLLDLFIDTRAELRIAFDFSDDIAEVTDWVHPIFGKLTKCEWLYFSGLHGERHRRQVENAIQEEED
ncbi:MAG: DinB family protein [Saprospiraceae bacterium]